MNLALFQKPSRYINSEINSTGFSRRAFREVTLPNNPVSVALAFPDVYEVGMSHLGLRILYDVINGLPYAFAERAFSPWTDLEAQMKRQGLPLSSLESKTPLAQFDVVGFSLQYELSYTTVLNMLHMGGIPVRSGDRLDAGDRLPLVVAGGPCTANPAPMAAFVDVFLIGDGEDAVVELVETVWRWKLSGDRRRHEVLQAISGLPGFYVPAVHREGSRITRRFVASLDTAPYPVKPVVPYTSLVHDRVTIEVSRGCTRGCRFCQAGMFYRPLRERSPENVITLAEESLRNTGYDEVSFSSLSAGDYSCLLPVVKECNRRFGKKRIALSLPSLRVGSVSKEVLGEIRSVRKTGFTMAPEAATDRLRAVINKDFRQEEYQQALKILFEGGWLNLKLYFMVGLPTETDEDVQAIREMALEALRAAKRNTGRFVNISITVSPFVPKTHTPFQWYGQVSLDEMRRKLRYLKDVLSRSKFKYKGHNEQMSLLEAVFSRGDERLADLIEAAWRSGCRLDGWSDLFDFSKWVEAMQRTGIDGPAYAERSPGFEETLPWDGIDIGVGKDFLRREYERALEGTMTQDCRHACASCGLKCAAPSSPVQSQGPSGAFEESPLAIPSHNSPPARDTGPGARARVRIRFSKGEQLRYLSHLELATAVLRGLRRAGVPVGFSEGFHPSPRVSFGPALTVGLSGEKEYFDMELTEPVDLASLVSGMNGTLPEGIRIQRAAVVPHQEPSLDSFVRRYTYRVSGSGVEALSRQMVEGSPASSSSSAAHVPLVVFRDGKEIDVSGCIEDMRVMEEQSNGGQETSVLLTLLDRDGLKVRVREMAGALFGVDSNELVIARTALYGWRGGWVEPL